MFLYISRLGGFLDPKDPLAHLYDVDDASTLITLADWYHDLAIHAGKAYFETGMVP